MLVLALTSFCFSDEKYIVLSASGNEIGSYEYTSTGPETVSFYTPVSRSVVVMNRYNPNKVSYTVSSPNIASQTPNPPVFDFHNGNAKITVTFKEQATVSFGFAGIPFEMCPNVTVITTVNFTHTEEVSEPTSKCWLYAPASKHASYKVTENKLTKEMRLVLYHMAINGNAYDSYGNDGRVNTQWQGDSGTPWLFKLTTPATISTKGSITFSGKADIESGVESEMLKVDQMATKFDEQLAGKIESQWWIPVIGCASPVFLLVTWAVAIYRLKRQAAADDAP